MEYGASFIDLRNQYAELLPTIMESIEKLIENGNFVGGKILDTFEESCQHYFDIKHAVGVGSGTDALILALKALGIGQGHSVLVPANTFIATPFAVSHCGAEVIFVDVDPKTYNIDIEDAKRKIRRNTKCIIPVHLYGQACNMDEIMKFAISKGLFVVEDCAQAIGATYKGQKVGTFGDVGCYSFYPAKNLGGLGQGGLVITNSQELSDTIRELSNIGRKLNSHFDFVHIGFNSRLDTLNAAFLQLGLKEIDKWNNHRQKVAELYLHLLSEIEQVTIPYIADDCSHVFHLYELKCENMSVRDGLREWLSRANIQTGLHYPIPCNKQPVYAHLNQTASISEVLSGQLLSLPMHPTLSFYDIYYIYDSISNFFNE